MHASADDAKPLVLVYGCPHLAHRLRTRGLETSTVRRLGQILQPEADLDARAIVIGPAVLPQLSIEETIPELRDRWPMVDVVIWAPKARGTLVREALTAGAKDVVLTTSPDTCARRVVEIIGAQQLLPRMARLGDDRQTENAFEGMYSRSRRMWDLFDTATRVAATEATVLILGETGTGKELLARAIHRRSGREGNFVPLNCGAVNETLIDSELFGHVKGAFTGATHAKAGLFRHARAGTLFLDEIGNVPLTAQYHLLRALQERVIRPVGSDEEAQVDARVIAATSSALETDVQSGRFREDLFYRLDVIRLELPPLRERPEDIIFLFAQFARRIAEEYNVERPDLRGDFLDALVEYEWPGNVRQLENFTERLVLTGGRRRLGASALRQLLPFRDPRVSAPAQLPRLVRFPGEGEATGVIDTNRTLADVVEPHVAAIERAYLEAALAQHHGRVGSAAKTAGISRRTLLRKMKQYGLDKAAFRGAAASGGELSPS